MIDVTPVPMDQFPLRWRLTDPNHRVLPAVHMDQIKPLDRASAMRLLDLTAPWYDEQPFTHGYFANVDSTSLDWESTEGVRRARKWLYQRGVPFRHDVYLSWDGTAAAVTCWKMVVKYWDDLWYPGSDDLVVFDGSLSWALFFWHEGEAYFATHPMKSRR